MIPVEKHEKGWLILANVDLNNWYFFQLSVLIFLVCSLSTALTSRKVEESDSNGHVKNDANRSNAPVYYIIIIIIVVYKIYSNISIVIVI